MTHTVEAIAWTLIHFCWQAALIAGVYRVAAPALAKRTSNLRYVLALSALLGMFAAAVFTFGYELQSSDSTMLAGAGSAMSGSLTSADYPRTVAPGMVSASRTELSSSHTGNSLPSVMGWIDAFWVLGVLALATRGVGGWWLIHRLRVSPAFPAPDAVRASFTRIADALGLHRPVLLRISSSVAGPLTIGTLRAIVLLPVSAVTQLGPDELEVVLAHELAHVRRADFFWNLVQTIVETLFFFHPAVWWLSGRIRHERELCCDDMALTVCPNPVVYASALFHLEEQRSRQMSLAMAFDGNQSAQTLRMRIARILGETMQSNSGSPVRPFSAAAVFAALIVLLLPAPQLLARLHPTVPAHSSIVMTQAAGVTAPRSMASPHPEVSASEPVPAPVKVSKTQPGLIARAETVQETTAPRASDEPARAKGSYIDRMKAAGYDVDLDKLIAMKIQDVTPEYARSMSQLGFGKLSADDLIACKIHGVSPEVIAEFKRQGLEVKNIQDAISYRIFQVTPEFLAAMKASGFKDLSSEKLIALRVQGVTPEYARSIVQQYPGATVDDVIKTRIFKIDADFIAQAKGHGFNNLSLDKLVQLRISGLLDDESVKP